MADLPPDTQAPRPDGARPDAEIPDSAFDGLDLGSVSDGVHATSSQWGDIAATASRRRQRRTWIIAAAALVVLLVGTTVVVVSRSGSDDGVQIAMDSGNADQFVIPPEDATDVNISSDGESSHLFYLHEGRPWQLTVTSPDAPGMEGHQGTDLAERASADSGGRAIPTPDLGTVHTACAGWWISPDGSNATALPTFSGPPVINWMMGARFARLMSNDQQGYGPLCDLATQSTADLEAELDGLRVVGADEFQRYLDGDVEHPGVTSLLQEDVIDATTTSVQEDPPADRRTAEEQIAAAVEALAGPYDVDTFPYLEDGTTRAEEYRELFDTARRQSGAAPSDGRPATDFSLTSLHFTTPELASIVIGMHTRLPSGEYDFSQGGQALLQDGRWVIAHDSIVRMLGRACLPPGGVSSEC